MNLTSAQEQAIAARGNVLVMAGAGTGKTRTLVERCLSCLLAKQSPASLDEILMVTFTESAAAEMRQRIRLRLEDVSRANPGQSRWREQLALFETAHIGTLHSFCLQLVRQHFYQLELDPQLTVLPEEESYLLAEESLEALLQKHYAGEGRSSEAVQHLIQVHGHGRDKFIRTLVRRLHDYTQTLPNPEEWFRTQFSQFGTKEPIVWKRWLAECVQPWRERWLETLPTAWPENELAMRCAKALRRLEPSAARADLATMLGKILEAGDCPKGRRTEWLNPLKPFLGEVSFLRSLLVINEGADPLAQDWDWVRPQVTTLLELAHDFSRNYAAAKTELGVVDFHDLEQFALRLLWDAKLDQPTPIARQWQAKLRFIFVDEYQDINAAQDKIILALSRPGAQGNRFLVGDVKQSIYRFRLANPAIFQSYAQTWRGSAGQVVALADNFRSREGILGFVNALFSVAMQPQLGGVAYDQNACLRFGAPDQRREGCVGAADPCVELHLRTRTRSQSEEPDLEEAPELAELLDLDETDKEARLIAFRLLELKSQAFPVWDEVRREFRPVQWADMAVLLRAPSGKAEGYAKEFSRLNLPLLVAHGGFYRSLEISDLLSVLQVLDNPLQDLPLLAVLRSPMTALAVDDLATIRLSSKGPFWSALRSWSEAMARQSGNSTAEIPLFAKVRTFLDRFARWRRLARQTSLSRCLEAVLAETHYGEWLLTQTRGTQRYANLARLLHLARQFDQFQRQGLFRFLRFIEGQQAAETEPQVAPVAEQDCIRLMSIHQSKGLEFPVVVVADLGKPFNLSDQRADVILDERYGLCPQIKPPHTGTRYPSLPYWLARQRQYREILGEELRLLYVAMTRARDRLILTGSGLATSYERFWQRTKARSANMLVPSARSCLDWLGCWFAQSSGCDLQVGSQGETEWLRWFFHKDTQLLRRPQLRIQPPTHVDSVADLAACQKLEQRLNWKYPATPATRQAAKTSVTALRRRAGDLDENDAPPRFQGATSDTARGDYPFQSHFSRNLHGSAAEIGNAQHRFLERVDLARAGSSAELKAEARRLVQQNALKPEEFDLLDFKALTAFWTSDLGRQIRANSARVRRELSFTARFTPAELTALTGEDMEPSLTDEFIVVQGVADLVVVRPHNLWLLDFKTDQIKREETSVRAKAYEPQLKIYAAALSRIYRREVSGCWLYFLASQRAIAVLLPNSKLHGRPREQKPRSGAGQLCLPLG
jgi:ATP-dependent helicase/nuclease subunit A